MISLKSLKVIWGCNPDVVVHIGAHEAEERNRYASLGWGSRGTIWVEAIEEKAAIVRARTVHMPNQTVHCALLSDVDGEDITFNIASNGQSSSMLEFGTHSDSYPTISFVDKRPLRTTRFDSLIDRLPEGRVYLCIDVQGVELPVLRGFGDLIDDVDYLFCEVNFREVYRDCTKFEDLEQFLEDKGFELAVLHDTGQGWGDAFFIRRSGTVHLRWARRIVSRVFPRLKRFRDRTRTRLRRNRSSNVRPARSDEFYPQVDNCQVPGLSLLLELFIGCKHDGVFVEVGGFDGMYVSNTWGLADRGWRGVIVEPVPHSAERCRAAHATHPKVTVVECAIGAEENSQVRLKVAGPLTTASAGNHAEYATIDWARRHLTANEIVATMTTLDALLHTHTVPEDFDVLVVDVEGYERQVFAGFDLTTWRPRMIIVELCDIHPDLKSSARDHAHLGASIVEAGYRTVYKDMMNTVLVRTDVWERAYSDA